MQYDIIKALLPWLFYFVILGVSDSLLAIAAVVGLSSLLLFNYRSLQRTYLLDCIGCLFFIFILFEGVWLQTPWILNNPQLCANITLLVISAGSFVLKTPFTMQYAKNHVSESYYGTESFFHINAMLTFALGLIFVYGVVIDALNALPLDAWFWLYELIDGVLIIMVIAAVFWLPGVYRRRINERNNLFVNLPQVSPINRIDLVDASIAYRTVGEKKPVIIMLPDFFMNMHAWEPNLLRALSHDYQLFLFDYPNVGMSLAARPLNIMQMGQVLIELVEKLKLDVAGVLGYALGGFVAQAAMVQAPRLFKRAILMNTDFGGKEAVRDDACWQALKEDKLSETIKTFFPEARVDALLPRLSLLLKAAYEEGSLPPDILKQLLTWRKQWYEQEQVFERLSILKMPALIISSEKDFWVSNENAQLLYDKYSHSDLIVYPDAGHGLIYEYPLELAGVVKDFLRAPIKVRCHFEER